MPVLPRLRPDLAWTPDAIHDARFGRSLRPRPAERDVLDALRAGVPSLPLLLQRVGRSRRARGEGPLSPDDLYRRVWGLARDLWFELDALPAYDRLAAWRPEPPPADAPLDAGRALFACTGCGRCCDHTDIGPIRRAEAARIATAEPGFGAHLTWLDDDLAVLSAGCEHCAYRRPDGLCDLHGRHGVGVKPLVCRQFPYRFTALGGRVVVSLDAECWQLSQALEAGRADPAAALAEVRAVWALGPICEPLPPVLFADPFTPLALEAWEDLRAGFEADVAAGADPVDALHALLRSAPRRPPAWLDEAAWATAFGRDFRPEPSRSEAWLLAELDRHLEAWGQVTPWRAPLADLLRAGLARLREGDRRPVLAPTDRDLLVQVARTHLDGANVLKKDNLELGVLSLAWRLRLAAEATAGSPRSAIDSAVASNKLLKDRRLGEYFRQNQVLFRRLAESPVRSAEETR